MATPDSAAAESESDCKPLTLSCDCIERTNAALAEKGYAFRLEEQPLTINYTTGVISFLNRAILSTEWNGTPTAAERKKGKRLVATYCPFCGKEYEFPEEDAPDAG